MKSVIVFFFFLFFSIFYSCKKDESGIIKIRIKNTSSYYYSNITVSDKNYGNLAPSYYSNYQIFNTAYSYAYVKLNIDTVVFEIIPIDFVGEDNLNGGNYAYLIGVSDYTNKRLSIELQKE